MSPKKLVFISKKNENVLFVWLKGLLLMKLGRQNMIKKVN